MDSKKLNFNQARTMSCKYTPYKDLLSLYANKNIFLLGHEGCVDKY